MSVLQALFFLLTDPYYKYVYQALLIIFSTLPRFFLQNPMASGIQISSAAIKEIHTEGSQPVRLRTAASITGSTACRSMVRIMLGRGRDRPYMAAAKTWAGMPASHAAARIRTAGIPMLIMWSEALNSRSTVPGKISRTSRNAI